jgi:hypothetical protein
LIEKNASSFFDLSEEAGPGLAFCAGKSDNLLSSVSSSLYSWHAPCASCLNPFIRIEFAVPVPVSG